ncbi:MAG: baseplate J/gp47 family protein [Comamonas sp.]
MPFDVPNLPTLIARAGCDIEGSQSLRRSDAAVLARVHSGATYGLYQYLAWQFAQLFPDTAEEDMLLRHGAGRGVVRKSATQAHGPVAVKGTAGAVVPPGARLATADGLLYEAVEGAVLVAGTASFEVQAIDVGLLGNQPAGAALQFVSPVAGVNSDALVAAAGLTGGTDIEDLEDYRDRVLERYRLVPHGGNADDYVTWAKEQAGVTRAWAKRNWVGPGTVGVFVVNDAATPITPAAPELAAIKAGIEAERPVTAELYVLAPVLIPVNYTTRVTPDTPRVRAAVESALQALHERESDLGAKLLHTHITEAISGAAGEVDHQLMEPAADVVPTAAQLLVYGGVTWL